MPWIAWGVRPPPLGYGPENGVDVWPNAAIWMQDELRSKVRQGCQYLQLRDINVSNSTEQ